MRLRDAEFVATDISIYLAARRRKGAHRRVDATDRTRRHPVRHHRARRKLLNDRNVRNTPPTAVGGMALSGPVAARRAIAVAVRRPAQYREAVTVRGSIGSTSRYGKNTLFWGRCLQRAAIGAMAIAFNHIPDLVIESDESGKRQKPQPPARRHITRFSLKWLGTLRLRYRRRAR